ncbi:g11770 [Coccomyxa elongata]
MFESSRRAVASKIPQQSSRLLPAEANARSSAHEAYTMAQQEVDKLWAELQRVEQKIEEQEARIEAATKAKELPELIASVKEKRDRLVEEKKDLRQSLNALQMRLATPSGTSQGAPPGAYAGLTDRLEVRYFPRVVNDFLQPVYRRAFRTPGGNILARLDQLEDQGRRLEDRATYPLISPTARDKVEAASCVLLDDDKPIGVAFFIAERVCLTCNHNLVDFEEGQQVTARQPSGGEQFLLTVSQRNTDLDYATLRSEQQHDFVTCYRGAPAKLVGNQIALCAFQISLEQELGEDYPLALSVMRGTVMRISRRGHHMVYECNSWPGDSGASLALYDGEVVGMHQEGVNSIKEIVERKRTFQERISDVEESLESAARSVAQGAIALLATAFPQV